MGKNVYLVVTDLHLFYKNLRNRKDYRNEMAMVLNELVKYGRYYKNLGFNVNMILLGDVFHSGYKAGVFNACYDNNFFVMWKNAFGNIYSVLGNHELSYYKDNPFYTLVTEIESKKVRTILNRVYNPVGSLNIIQVPDVLEDGEVVIHFNHFNTPVSKPWDGRCNIGLFHQDIVSEDIIQASRNKYGLVQYAPHPVDIEGSHILDGYNYCFFGHLHTIYGDFRTDSGVILSYLASLGRTNVTEVSDAFLTRKIPAICVNDGKLVEIHTNKIKLASRNASVLEDSVKKDHAVAEVQKEQKLIRSFTMGSDDPVKNVIMNLSENAMASEIFAELLNNAIDKYHQELSLELQTVLQKEIV